MTSRAFQRAPERVSPKRKRGLDYVLVLLGAVLMTCPLLLITGGRNEVTGTRYLITAVRKENDTLAQQQRKLRAELNLLTRPNRVFEEALAIGLRPLSRDRRVEVRIVPSTENTSMVARMGEEP